LVLNWVYRPFGSPVDFLIVDLWKGRSLSDDLRFLASITEKSPVLFLCPGRHVVMAYGEVGLLRVDLVNFSIHLGKKTKSEIVLLSGSEVEAVLRDMLNERLFEVPGDWLFTIFKG